MKELGEESDGFMYNRGGEQLHINVDSKLDEFTINYTNKVDGTRGVITVNSNDVSKAKYLNLSENRMGHDKAKTPAVKVLKSIRSCMS